jgi:uncharacterized protein (DUF2236 family)
MLEDIRLRNVPYNPGHAVATADQVPCGQICCRSEQFIADALPLSEEMSRPNTLARVAAERVVLLGWSRAILMQLAHPLIAAGVLQHSEYRGGVISAAIRLHHTVRAMRRLTFGDAQQRHAALSRIQGIHRTVHGTLTEAAGPFAVGTPYSAEDPALLLWVHATLVESTADIYARVVAPLSADDLDTYCEQSIATLLDLGGDPATAPRTWQALRVYMASVQSSGVLAVTAAARDLGHAVLTPRAAGLPVPFTGLQKIITVGLLPTGIRDSYRFEWNARRERRFALAIRSVRAIRSVTPRRLAWWPDARKVTTRVERPATG